MYFDSKNPTECSGCTACLNACPKGAILMCEDKEGFLYPSINEDSCIHCNICRKICSWENPVNNADSTPSVFASVLKDKEERKNSTSGGVFFSISRWVIENGGIVFGAAFEDNFKLVHYGAQTIEELQRLRGSKYLQSDLGLVFQDVKHYLESGRLCYFTGTGCQVAGLKAYLKKDYVSLITSDLICHGTPSQKCFSEHISFMENKYHDKIIGYQFRDLKSGKGGETCFFQKRKPVINPTYELSPYLYSFMYGFTFRVSCYDCRFATIPRQGDITLGDFWGAEKFAPEIDRSNGVSLLLINNEKGKRVWECVKDEFSFVETKVENAVKYNENIIHPMNKPQIRDLIYKEIDDKGYSYVSKKYFRSPVYWKTKFFLFIGKTPFMKLYMRLRKVNVLC